MMCLYFGGFTGMYSETALNIALPQLSLALRRRAEHRAVARSCIHARDRFGPSLRKSSYEMVHGTPNNPICSLLVSYRSFD